MDWKLAFFSVAVCIATITGQHLVTAFPRYMAFALFASAFVLLCGSFAPPKIAPVLPALAAMAIGAGLLSGGATYWLTNSHWVGDDHYIPNIKLMMQNLSSQAMSVAHSSNDADYLKRQLAAYECMRAQIVWLNKNMGGDIARDYAAASGETTLPSSNKFSKEINEQRSKFYALIKAREEFLKGALASKNWPKSPRHLLSDPAIC